MVKRNRKVKLAAEEIEAQRMEAHEQVGEAGVPFVDAVAKNILTHEQAVQGANLASGITVEPGVPLEDGVGERSWKDDLLERASEGEREAVELSEGEDLAEEIDIELSGGRDEYGMPVEKLPGEEEPEEEDKPPTSVVADKFKLKYIEQAKAAGISGKAAKRSSWDWLAQRIAEQCLGEKEKINITDFMDLLECNGVDYSRWTNRNRGWEGRFRMTGRVALQKVVANQGFLKTMTGESVPPPEWVEKYRDKS